MKKFVMKTVSMILTGAMLFSLSACGEDTKTAELTEFEGDSVEGALEGVTLSVATSGLFAPFTYYDEDGTTLIGFDLDVIQELQEYLGFEINGGQIQAMDYSAITTSVSTGKVDIALAALSMTEERKEVMYFTDSYYTGGKYLIVNQETSPSELTSVDMLTSGDYKVAVEKGTSSHLYLQNASVPEAAIEVHDTITTAYESLEQGMVDCMIQDSPSFAVYAATKTGTKLVSVGEEFATDDTYGIAISFQIAEKNPNIVDIFNRALKEMTENGTMDSLREKWCE